MEKTTIQTIKEAEEKFDKEFMMFDSETNKETHYVDSRTPEERAEDEKITTTTTFASSVEPEKTAEWKMKLRQVIERIVTDYSTSPSLAYYMHLIITEFVDNLLTSHTEQKKDEWKKKAPELSKWNLSIQKILTQTLLAVFESELEEIGDVGGEFTGFENDIEWGTKIGRSLERQKLRSHLTEVINYLKQK